MELIRLQITQGPSVRLKLILFQKQNQGDSCVVCKFINEFRNGNIKAFVEIFNYGAHNNLLVGTFLLPELLSCPSYR